MDARQRQDLNNHITGHYGEGQFQSEYWPVPSAHQEYWERNICALVYEYDPTDNGPEVETANAIFVSHYASELQEEREASMERYVGGILSRYR